MVYSTGSFPIQTTVKIMHFPQNLALFVFPTFFCNNIFLQVTKYPRVTSFNALKQSTGFCAHLHVITFPSRKNIILNKRFCFQSKHTFWEIWELLFCLNIAVNKCATIIYFDRHQFRRISLAVAENNFVHCSPVFTGCTLYCTRKIKDYQQFTTKNQQAKCSMRSFNFKMVLYNFS